jgi:hypothetical protein
MATLTNGSDQGLTINYSTTWTETSALEFLADWPLGMTLQPGGSVTISDALAEDLSETALAGLAVTE